MSGSWSQHVVAGHAVHVWEPVERARFAIIHLDGEPSLREDARFAELLQEQRLMCISPDGGPSWWSDRICQEFDAHVSAERFLLEMLLPHLREAWGFTPPAVGLLGVGSGGQGALRLAFKQPRLFPVVAGLAPLLEFHERYGRGFPLDDMYTSKEQARQDTAILHIHPAHQPPHIFYGVDPMNRETWRGGDRLHEKLTALGVPHEAEMTLRAETGLSYVQTLLPRAIRFVVQGLQEQARRLL